MEHMWQHFMEKKKKNKKVFPGVLIVYLVFVFPYKFLYIYRPASTVTFRVTLCNIIFFSHLSLPRFFFFFNIIWKLKLFYTLKIKYFIPHMELCPNVVMYAYVLCVRVQSTVRASISPQLLLHNKSMILGKQFVNCEWKAPLKLVTAFGDKEILLI